MKVLIVLSTLCVWAVWGQANLLNYGLPAPSADSCAGVTVAGWYVDRAYGAKCFIRRVLCTSTGQYNNQHNTCDIGQVYTVDGNTETCQSASDTTVITNCGVNVVCNRDSMGVVVTNGAIWGQVTSPLQFGGQTCNFAYNTLTSQYTYSVSLTNNEWNSCGVTRELITDPTGGDGYSIKYSTTVKRYELRSSLTGSGATSQRVETQQGNVVITREKCFMVDIACYYNSDGTVHSSFQPSAASPLTESANSQLTFDLQPVDCAANTNPVEVSEPVVFVNVDVCYRAAVTSTWHSNIRVQIKKCWAENSAGTITYDLGHRLSTNNPPEQSDEGTFAFECFKSTNNPYKEYFKFSSFRFQDSGTMNNIASYTQTIVIKCDVVACDHGDTTSTDCATTCNPIPTAGRKRRDVTPISQMSLTTVTGRAFVLPREIPVPPHYIIWNNMFPTIMVASGVVLAVVVIGLLITLNKMKRQPKYGTLNEAL